MNFNAHDNLVLVAPRPVRLAAPTPFAHFHTSILHRPQARSAVRLVSAPADALDRLKLADDTADDESKSESAPPSDRDPASPRASPRSGLTSEALEEFLSILRPSTALFFPPTSPVLHPSNANAPGVYFPYRRTPSTRLSPAVSSDGLGVSLVDHGDHIDKENDNITYPFKLWGDHLASPVARSLARNPFQRHASYDNTVAVRFHSAATTPSPVPVTLSPTVVPLPPPTPDEDLVFTS